MTHSELIAHVRSRDRSLPEFDCTHANLCGFSFPTSDKVGFYRQYITMTSPKTSETRKIARMLASSQGEFELVWIQISFRGELCTHLILRQITGTFWVVELLGKCALTVYFSYSVKAVLQPFFHGPQKQENYIKGPLVT